MYPPTKHSMTRTDSAVLETEAGPHALEEIEEFLELTWAAHAHVPHPVRLHMGIAAGEIAANIVEHTAKGQVVHIRMTVSVLTDAVRIDFVDDGAPAEVNLDTVSMPDDMAERGRGLPLAQAVLDELSYRRTTCNEWTLRKRFS
jgi:serine/threonine-protein kinase RsbW